MASSPVRRLASSSADDEADTAAQCRNVDMCTRRNLVNLDLAVDREDPCLRAMIAEAARQHRDLRALLPGLAAVSAPAHAAPAQPTPAPKPVASKRAPASAAGKMAAKGVGQSAVADMAIKWAKKARKRGMSDDDSSDAELSSLDDDDIAFARRLRKLCNTVLHEARASRFIKRAKWPSSDEDEECEPPPARAALHAKRAWKGNAFKRVEMFT